MALFKPKFITFDCYGTLIFFDMAGAAKRCFAERVDANAMMPLSLTFRAIVWMRCWVPGSLITTW